MADLSGNTFIKLQRSNETNELMKDPPTFMLLCQIAIRARISDSFNNDNLSIGESLIGDYRNIGLTRSQYRTALDKLKKANFLTIKTTNRGTIAKLTDTRVFSVIPNYKSPPESPDRSHQIATNNNDKNEKKENIYNRLDTKKEISFEYLSNGFINIWPVVIMFCNIPAVNYVSKGVSNYVLVNASRSNNNSDYSLTQQQALALIDIFFRVGFNYKDEGSYKTLGDVIKHCINWIGNGFKISESDMKKNHKLIDAKLFWKAYRNPDGTVLRLTGDNGLQDEGHFLFKKPKKHEINLEFVSPEFKESFNKWFEYRQKVNPFKTQKSLESAYKELLNMSGLSVTVAARIVQYSIGNDYMKLYKPQELRNN